MDKIISAADVKAIRDLARMTQQELADYLGLRHRSQVHHLETGRTVCNGPKAILLERLKQDRKKSRK
jgi:DNA-binding transcriptional regulator YiaG